jgi:hypothetical protein
MAGAGSVKQNFFRDFRKMGSVAIQIHGQFERWLTGINARDRRDGSNNLVADFRRS